MQPFSNISSQVIMMPFDDIDTDQIIPARFLKITDKSGLATNLFYDWRYDRDGNPKEDFVLNQSKAKKSNILFTGNNFGCGSSREHAAWALSGFGFKSIIATSFGDIFKSNALKNGLLPIKVDLDTHKKMRDILLIDPEKSWEIDLSEQNVTLPNGEKVAFEIDTFSKTCLISGVDELGYILSYSNEITNYEITH